MLQKIKKFFRSRTICRETEMKIISLFIEKTYPVFAGTFKKKVNKDALFVIGKTKYGPIKIPISENVYNILNERILANRNKIPVSVDVKLKIQEIKKQNHTETKVLAGTVIFDDNHKKKSKT